MMNLPFPLKISLLFLFGLYLVNHPAYSGYEWDWDSESGKYDCYEKNKKGKATRVWHLWCHKFDTLYGFFPDPDWSPQSLTPRSLVCMKFSQKSGFMIKKKNSLKHCLERARHTPHPLENESLDRTLREIDNGCNSLGTTGKYPLLLFLNQNFSLLEKYFLKEITLSKYLEPFEKINRMRRVLRPLLPRDSAKRKNLQLTSHLNTFFGKLQQVSGNQTGAGEVVRGEKIQLDSKSSETPLTLYLSPGGGFIGPLQTIGQGKSKRVELYLDQDGKYRAGSRAHKWELPSQKSPAYDELELEWQIMQKFKRDKGVELRNENKGNSHLGQIQMAIGTNLFYGEINRKELAVFTHYYPLGDLENYLKTHPEMKKDISGQIILARDLLLAIEELHEKNIIHRDIKPQNIFLRNKNDNVRAYLGDFGFSFQKDDDLSLTNRKKISGTPLYLSPIFVQHALALPSVSHVDMEIEKQNDLWGFGVTLFTLITGQDPPWPQKAKTVEETLRKIASLKNQDIEKALEMIPNDHPLKSIIRKALCLDPLHFTGPKKLLLEF